MRVELKVYRIRHCDPKRIIQLRFLSRHRLKHFLKVNAFECFFVRFNEIRNAPILMSENVIYKIMTHDKQAR